MQSPALCLLRCSQLFCRPDPHPLHRLFVATGIGQLPATVVYSYVGGMLTGGVKYLVTGLLCIFSLGILGTIFKQLYNDRQAKKAGNAHE